MRGLRNAVALGVACASAIAWFGGSALTSQPVRAGAVNDSSLDAVVLQTLDEVDADGFNTTTNGLYINWSATDPSQVNFTDNDPTRHDPLTDLRNLDNMEEYEALNPGDTSQQVYIQRMYPVVASEYHDTKSNVGWVYWELLDLAQVTGDAQWLADAQTMAAAFDAAIVPATQVPKEDLTDNGHACSDGYRVDATLERSFMLLDAGKRFDNPVWTSQGYATWAVVRSQAFDPTYGLYNREMCGGEVYDPEAKTEEIADEARDGLLAGEYIDNPSLVGQSISLLDTLVANQTGLHDTTDGGWCPLFNMATAKLNCGTKLSRQYLLLRAFHDADEVDPGRYTAEELELINLVPSMATPAPHVGFLYERTRTFGIDNGENWISSEADGIVAGALLSVLSDGGTTTTSTTSTASTTTTTNTTNTTNTTTTTSTTKSSSSSSSSTSAPSPACPSTSHTTTGVVSSGSASVFVTATGSTLCATLSWIGNADLQVLIYNSAGTTVLGEGMSISPQFLQISSTPGTVYKVKVKPLSGAAPYTLVTRA